MNNHMPKDILYNPSTAPTRRIAILIDGDNAQPSLLDKILAETGKYGVVTIRRIYGDWTTSNMGGWKDMLQSNAIQPIQQFRYTTGKNATDSAMIIDAMDILFSGLVDGFCLVSSDSDYTRLATRIREKGFYVMGIGKRSTPRAFVSACDVFVYTENLLPERTSRKPEPRKVVEKISDKTVEKSAEIVAIEAAAEAAAAAEATAASLQEPVPLLKNAFDMAVQDDGYASLGAIGNHLRQLDPGFDSRTYGFKQLSLLIRAFPKIFEVKDIKRRDGTFNMFVRLKE
jgi:uncharacterized LabA/DUF88 family protein